jgi:ABC-type phosphate transport system substrate-binding protein
MVMNKKIFVILLSLIIFSGISFATEFKIIANSNVLIDSIKESDLKKIFLGKKTLWKNDMRIIPVLLDDKDVHNSFIRKILKKTPSQFLTYWKRMVFTGRAKNIKTLKDEQAVSNYVTVTKGAIGYISKKNIQTQNVKIISVH